MLVCGESKGLYEAEMPCSDTRIVKIYFDFCSTINYCIKNLNKYNKNTLHFIR